MGQRHQHSHSGTDGSAWLNTLIDGFERTEALGNVPCDTKTLSAAKSRLNTPAEKRAKTVGQRRRSATLEFQH